MSPRGDGLFSCLRIACVCIFGATFAATSSSMAQRPPLEISSPVSGTIVNPGQEISVNVVSPAGVQFTGILVVGGGPIGISTMATKIPAEISVKIPTDIACRLYPLTAFGIMPAGGNLESKSVDIDVERPDLPVSLSSQFKTLILEAEGQSVPVLLVATFADGSELEVTESSRLVYKSTNPEVATVNSSGMVTAGAAGTGAIVVTYNNPQQGPNRQLSIPVTVLAPALGAVPDRLSFGSGAGIQVGTSEMARITLTNDTMSDSKLRVKHIAVSGDFTENDNCIVSSPLPLGGTCVINVTFKPSAKGERNGALTISNSFNGVPTVIPLQGIGR